MIKVAFASPPLGFKERYGGMAPFGSNMPSLALLSLAAAARQAGFKSGIIQADSLNISYNEILDRISRSSANCLAITATTFSINKAHELAILAKQSNKELLVLIGGNHLSALPEETMKMFPDFDIGVMNEGESTLVELLSNLNQDKQIDHIQGIVFRRKGGIVRNPRRGLIDNLDALPFPAWDLLEGFPRLYHPPFFRSKRLPAASIVTSRGCPNQCIFCSKTVFGDRVRFFSAEYIFREMELLHNKYGINDILIEDDTFLIDKKRVSDICELILNSGLDINWSCLGRVDNIEEHLLRQMKKAGCWQIGFGIESGSQDILDFTKKGINLDEAARAIRIAKKAGILTKGFFILGLPFDSPDSIKKTISFAKNSGLNDISVNFMTPLPGTMLYNKAEEYGEFNKDYSKMNLLEVVFIPKGLSRKELKKYSLYFIKTFYLRPKIIFSYFLRIIRNPSSYGKAVKLFLVFLKRVFIGLD